MNDLAKWRIKEWFSDLEERTLERLRIYHIELLRWTKTVNLISAGTAEEADRIHFADAILGARMVFENNSEISELWDLGSGNGIPGVIFSILWPTLTVICVDSDERKISFLKQLGLRLELDNLVARCLRVEAIPSGSISVACARGFAALDKSLLFSDKQFVAGGQFFHFKGPDYESEAANLKKAPNLKWSTSLVGQYILPVVQTVIDGKTVEKKDSRFIVKTVKG